MLFVADLLIITFETFPSLPRTKKGQKRKLTKYAEIRPSRYEARPTLFWIFWEVVLSLLMVCCIAIWFFYAIALVQDSAFSTRYKYLSILFSVFSLFTLSGSQSTTPTLSPLHVSFFLAVPVRC